jgi:hypothetical protein
MKVADADTNQVIDINQYGVIFSRTIFIYFEVMLKMNIGRKGAPICWVDG